MSDPKTRQQIIDAILAISPEFKPRKSWTNAALLQELERATAHQQRLQQHQESTKRAEAIRQITGYNYQDRPPADHEFLTDASWSLANNLPRLLRTYSDAIQVKRAYSHYRGVVSAFKNEGLVTVDGQESKITREDLDEALAELLSLISTISTESLSVPDYRRFFEKEDR